MTEDENQLGAAGNSAEEAAADSYGSDDTMSEAEASEQADTETAAEGEASEKADTETAAEEKPRKYHAPLYIAACIFLAAVIFFGVKLCFFIVRKSQPCHMSFRVCCGSSHFLFCSAHY